MASGKSTDANYVAPDDNGHVTSSPNNVSFMTLLLWSSDVRGFTSSSWVSVWSRYNTVDNILSQYNQLSNPVAYDGKIDFNIVKAGDLSVFEENGKKEIGIVVSINPNETDNKKDYGDGTFGVVSASDAMGDAIYTILSSNEITKYSFYHHK